MKKLISFLIITILLISSLSSCNTQNNNEEETSVPTSSNAENLSKSYINPYTGNKTKKDPKETTPFMTIIENSKSARPQSGLSFADILYETSAEGGIPRFMAIFHENYPDKIGPVRSVRPYFINLANEHSLPFAHCGGSKEALDRIANDSSIMSINEISNGSYFFRDNKRVAPHNLYTSSESILKALKAKNFNPSADKFLNYDIKYFENEDLQVCNTINIKPSQVYTTSYKYENGKYTKSMDGQIAYDASTNKPLSFTNVVIQLTDISLQSDKSHLNINLISNGDGYVFSQGRVKKVKWVKDTEFSNTKLYDEKGDEISLTPGNTIWNIIDKNSKCEY